MKKELTMYEINKAVRANSYKIGGQICRDYSGAAKDLKEAGYRISAANVQHNFELMQKAEKMAEEKVEG